VDTVTNPDTPSSIYDVLAKAGIARTRDKMVCPHCGAQKVTASESREIATCWGCNHHWFLTSFNDDHVDPARDWGSFIVAKIASLSMDHLPQSATCRDWLFHRLLPDSHSEWLAEQDLGAVPPNLPLLEIVRDAKQLLSDAATTAQQKIDASLADAARTKLPTKVRAAQEAAAKATEAIAEEARHFKHLTEKILPLLEKPDWHEAIVYIYRDASNRPCSLHVRQYAAEPADRKVITIQPRPGARGVFGAANATYAVEDGWKGLPIAPLIIVEGEHNLLALQAAIHLRWGLHYFLPAIAVGGKSGADIACIRALADKQDPLVIYDNDKISPATGKPGGYDLVNAVATQMFCRATTTSTKDLDDYFRLHPAATPQEFYRDVIAPQKFVPLAIETVRDMIQMNLYLKDEANRRELTITDMIVYDVKRRAKLFNVDGYALLRLPGRDDFTSDYVAVRKGDAGFHAFLRQYGITKPDWIDACGRALNIEAAKRDTPRRTLHSISAWVDDCLYLNCYEGSMVRVSVYDEDQVVFERVRSGRDGVLMHRYADSLHDTEARTRPWLHPKFDLKTLKLGSLEHFLTPPWRKACSGASPIRNTRPITNASSNVGSSPSSLRRPRRADPCQCLKAQAVVAKHPSGLRWGMS
jgi:hypothetical protein